MTLTQVQEAKIFCIKHGHAKFVSIFMGYVHCGRCTEQIGDTYSSPFNFDDTALIGHKCNKCDNAVKKLSNLDKEILQRVEADGKLAPDYEIILKGLKFIG